MLELEPFEYAPGSSLPELQRSLGNSRPLALVLAHLQRVVATTDALIRGALRNVNVLALNGDKQTLNHAILSLPRTNPAAKARCTSHSGWLP